MKVDLLDVSFQISEATEFEAALRTGEGLDNAGDLVVLPDVGAELVRGVKHQVAHGAGEGAQLKLVHRYVGVI
jgi:hypothetical protein